MAYGVSYGVSLRRVVTLFVAATVAAAAAYLVPELWALAIVLLALGIRAAFHRPALVLEAAGLRYVNGFRRDFAAWSAVDAVRVRQERHFLAFGRNVEIDLSDDTLIVLPGSGLGADPDEVAASIEAAWHEAIRSAKRS